MAVLFSFGALSHALSSPEPDGGGEALPPPEGNSPYVEEPAPAAARDVALERRAASALAGLARRLDDWERDARADSARGSSGRPGRRRVRAARSWTA